jgi:hypothetical protein
MKYVSIDSPVAPAHPETHPADADELRTLITAARTHRDDYGQRQVYVRIDDGPRVALLYGESVTMELQPGRHTLRAHNTLFWKRIEFQVEPGEHLEFQLINSASFWLPAVVGLLGAAPLFLRVIKRSLV